MKLKDKLEALRVELDTTIQYFQYKHRNTKRRANTIKISSICFSAFITVILGLNTNNQSIDWWFKNIALILGAIVTIINAVDAFFNYGALWIKNTVTLSRLQELRRKITFYSAGFEEADISRSKLNEFLGELQGILKDDMKEWLRIKEKISRASEEVPPKEKLIDNFRIIAEDENVDEISKNNL